MEQQLLSGLFGALIATILSIIYLYFSEKRKIRAEVALEVIGFCDDIYHRSTNVRILKERKYSQIEIDKEEYRAHSKELTALLTSTKLHAKVAITFGSGAIFDEFIEFGYAFRKASGILRKASRENWQEENLKFLDLIESKIEPLRRSILENLINSVKIRSIVYDLLRAFTAPIKKIMQ